MVVTKKITTVTTEEITVKIKDNGKVVVETEKDTELAKAILDVLTAKHGISLETGT